MRMLLITEAAALTISISMAYRLSRIDYELYNEIRQGLSSGIALRKIDYTYESTGSPETRLQEDSDIFPSAVYR